LNHPVTSVIEWRGQATAEGVIERSFMLSRLRSGAVPGMLWSPGTSARPQPCCSVTAEAGTSAANVTSGWVTGSLPPPTMRHRGRSSLAATPASACPAAVLDRASANT
jgi:hypothetical protein